MSTPNDQSATPSESPLPPGVAEGIRRILIVDDNAAIHQDFDKTLASRQAPARLDAFEAALFDGERPELERPVYDLAHALQGRDGFKMVEAALEAGTPFCVAFVDMRMPPGWDGLETIEHLWKVDPDLQVCICTAYADHTWDQIGATLGFTDQLLILKKPFDNIEVCQIATALAEKWALKKQARLKIDQLEKMVEHRTSDLRSAAMHDKLTGLPNRAYLNERVEHLMRARQNPRTANSAPDFGLLFLDFDRFKVVNDSLGHEVGDKLLISIADRLYLAMRGPGGDEAATPGLCARLGGDEFVVLVENLESPGRALDHAKRLIEVLSAPYSIDGHEVQSTASIGVTTTHLPYARREDMMRDADTAMYSAKATGRGRAVMFDPSMHARAMARLNLENEMRRAIARDELTLLYQPIVNIETGRLTGFESLVRWIHPDRGLLLPADFIMLAEETGLIVPMTNGLIRAACRQWREWRDIPDPREALPEPFAININLSRRQLCDPNLVKTVRYALAEFAVPPSCIKLEITETAIMDDQERAQSVLDSLRELGVRLLMDDFGSGYSSLNCLHQFRLDGLKVDRQFIATVSSQRDYSAVVHAIISLAHNLRMSVVAEGVETEAQRSMLMALECDYAQGFLYGRPMTPADARALIVRDRSGEKSMQDETRAAA
jgi:diguanylate cyclase (GGDEF)-like protein